MKAKNSSRKYLQERVAVTLFFVPGVEVLIGQLCPESDGV